MGGDLNLGLEKIDRQGKGTNNDKSAKILNNYLAESGMTDCWRQVNQDAPGFTWRKLRPSPMFSRLDYMFISETLLQYLESVTVVPGFKTDHSIVMLKIAFQPLQRGPGYWKFNTSLLHDKDYLDKINNLIDIELAQDFDSYCDKWEIIQLSIRSSMLQFAAHRQKSRRNKISILEHKIKKLENQQISQESTILLDTENHIRQLKRDLQLLLDEKTKGAVLRSGSKWAKEGEKPTKYFLNLEKHRALKKTICRLKLSNGTVITEQKLILNEMHEFYSKLYTSKGPINVDYLERSKVQPITDEDKHFLDTNITEAEISAALKELPNNKCPGTSGIPVDFIKVFWAKLRQFFFELFKEIIHKGRFHLTARRGIISLLEKLAKDPLYLANWRPLSLLNADYKIFSKLLAKRLQKILPKIIHESQTGFMKGRQAAEGIIKLQEIMHECNARKKLGIIVSFDFEKAFDTVEWQAIYLALDKYGVGEKFINMVKILYNQPISCVYNNGYWGKWFQLTRSTRQGCCFSPLIFNVIVELLGNGIRNNQDIQGLSIGKQEVKSGQYADDLWTALSPSAQNINNTIKEIDFFGTFSGLRLNYSKCAILRIGPFKDSEAQYYTQRRLFWSPGAIKILGVYITPLKVESYYLNFIELLDKVEVVLSNWENRALTVMGKITVVNSLIQSLFVHRLMALPTPQKAFFERYKIMITNYLWGSSPAKIAYSKLVQDYNKLGLKLVDLETKQKALLATWPVKWKEMDSPWVYEHLPIKDSRVWECNLNLKDAKAQISDDSLSVVQHVRLTWTELHFEHDTLDLQDILNENLWGNSNIRRCNRPIFQKQLLASKVDKVIDIMDVVNKKFLTYDQIVNSYGSTVDCLLYLSIIAAIPNRWKVVLRNEELGEPIDKIPRLEKYPGAKGLSKKFYWKIIECTFPLRPFNQALWKADLDITIEEEEWWDLFPRFLSSVYATKLRYFQYRILTQTLTTNVLRNKWCNEVSPKCSFCQMSLETVVHMLVNCPVASKIWKALTKWIRHFMNIEIKLTPALIILNNYQGKDKQLINTFIIVVKQHIYASRCKQEIPTINTSITRLHYWHKIEWIAAQHSGNLQKHMKKWHSYVNF